MTSSLSVVGFIIGTRQTHPATRDYGFKIGYVSYTDILSVSSLTLLEWGFVVSLATLKKSKQMSYMKWRLIPRLSTMLWGNCRWSTRSGRRSPSSERRTFSFIDTQWWRAPRSSRTSVCIREAFTFLRCAHCPLVSFFDNFFLPTSIFTGTRSDWTSFEAVRDMFTK